MEAGIFWFFTFSWGMTNAVSGKPLSPAESGAKALGGCNWCIPPVPPCPQGVGKAAAYRGGDVAEGCMKE